MTAPPSAPSVDPAVDHLVFGAPDLERGLDRIEELLGARPSPGGRHPAYGTRNALLALGPSCYLEVMAPDPGLPVPPRGVLFGLDRMSVPRPITWVLRHSSIEQAAARTGIGSVEPGWRERPDGSLLEWRLSDPYVDRMGGVIPFLIDWGDTPHPAASVPTGGALVELRLKHPSPARVRDVLTGLGIDDGHRLVCVERGDRPRITARIRARGRIVELA